MRELQIHWTTNNLNYTPIRYSHDQSWLAWSNSMTIDQSTSPRQTNRRPHSGGFATNQLNNIVWELQVHLATLTLPTSGFAWSILLVTHRAKDYQSRPHPWSLNTGTMAHKVMDQQLENIVPNHGTRIISHWLNKHWTINQLTSPCTHTHST